MQKPSDLIARDRQRVWHPYTQHGLQQEPLAIQAAQGAMLRLADGREVIDGLSSWWATLHGHGETALVEAASEQLRTLDHVLFAGTTHEPAVRLAERLVDVAPAGLSRVFYSDNGSTAVEVALKMVVQNFAQNGQSQRKVFVALEGAYHGDTFGSMSVGDPDPFFEAYRPMLFESVRIPPRESALLQALDNLGERAAGVILEPLLQGAAGMRVHSADFVRAVRQACDQHGIAMIADEVMTGFGRTGTLFACEQAQVSPDLLCLAKGLTGGMFPLSATLAREDMFQGFWSEDRTRTFFHGHTFTANPVGCAMALRSLDLVQERDVPGQLRVIGETIRAEIAPLEGHAHVRNLRQLGGLVAFDWCPPAQGDGGYLHAVGPRVGEIALQHGVLLRPLGNVMYALPPACTSASQAKQIGQAMLAVVAGLS